MSKCRHRFIRMRWKQAKRSALTASVRIRRATSTSATSTASVARNSCLFPSVNLNSKKSLVCRPPCATSTGRPKESAVLAIPMLPNGAPDRDQMCEATSIDVSLGGMALAVVNREQIPSRNWILGIEQTSGQIGYVNAFLRRVNYHVDQLQVGVIFQNDQHDFLGSRNLTPDIDLQSKRFKHSTSDDVLRQWAEVGVLRHELLHRAKLCPECHAAPVFGMGCSECGSFRIQFSDLIHHFACAFVDEAERFRQGDALECPKMFVWQLGRWS